MARLARATIVVTYGLDWRVDEAGADRWIAASGWRRGKQLTGWASVRIDEGKTQASEARGLTGYMISLVARR